MGNYRSGRRFVPDAKITVEQCCSLDIARWTRDGLIRPEAMGSGTVYWTSSRTGGITDSVGYSIDMKDPHVQLLYTFRSEVRRYRVELVSTSPHYGGLRWWFLCPAWVGGRVCLRRVRKLYLAPGTGIFACRSCCRLSYTSQREDYATRELVKAQAIRRRLGGSGSIGEPFPVRPKGMWRRTYIRLRKMSEGMLRGSLQAALARESPDYE